MRRRSTIVAVPWSLAVVIALHASALAADIKETTRLTITGPGLAAPLEVTEPRVLAASNVFAGTFIGVSAAELPRSEDWTVFTLTFDIQTATGVKRSAYTVMFAKSRWTDRALVYVPGRGDAVYRRNISTILRVDQEGLWHHASTAWAAAIDGLLP
jgi:hypothetical protein